MALDDVRVHYNSSAPASLNALAYTRGADIFVGPGQEKHLPHEAWHVVQQARGRVDTTAQVQGINANHSQHLEGEADEMGGQAAGLNPIRSSFKGVQAPTTRLTTPARGAAVAQFRLNWTAAKVEADESNVGGSFEEYRSILDALRRYAAMADEDNLQGQINYLDEIVQWCELQLKNHPEEARNTVVTQVRDDAVAERTEMRGLKLDPALSSKEKTFLSGSPRLETAEDKMREWMSDPDAPMKHEIGLIYDKGQLKGARKGHAATASDNATVAIEDSDLDAANTTRTDIAVTHNHPGGAPFSKGDVQMAVGKGIREIRAAGKFGTFILRRSGPTWTIDTKAVTMAFLDGEKAWGKACLANPKAFADYRPKDKGLPGVGETFKEDFFLAKHYACKLLAKNTGVFYEHPNEQALIDERLQYYEARAARAGDERAGLRHGQDLAGAGKGKDTKTSPDDEKRRAWW